MIGEGGTSGLTSDDAGECEGGAEGDGERGIGSPVGEEIEG